MQTSKIDIAVLVIFFCREEPLSKVFEQIKLAKPSRLYLYQDGPRTNCPDDMSKIAKCRQIVESVDWECEVHRWYQEENQGCDPSEYIAQKWMFSTEEYGIVLEDDDIPSQSFFLFCKELLEKYKDDLRIGCIMGMNNVGVYHDTDESYMFTRKGSIWGWASWKRVIDEWDPEYTWLDDVNKLKNIKANAGRKAYKALVKAAKAHRTEGVAYYETVLGADIWINGRFNIVPKYNMISDAGQTEDATHGVEDVRLLPAKTQRILSMKRYEIDFPLVHPKEVYLHNDFEAAFQNMWGSRIEYYLRCMIYLSPKELFKKLKKSEGVR